MKTSTQWQVARGAAERYQTILTPTILGPFAQALVAFARLRPAEKVVDVGCGTGAAARFAAAQIGQTGSVFGVDINPGMIEVAQSLPPVAGAPTAWRVAPATDLPLADGEVDVVLCAQTLQFLPAKRESLIEFHRVLRPGGRAALSLWCSIEDNPYFQVLVATIERHIGKDVAAGLDAAFALTSAEAISRLLGGAGFRQIEHEIAQLDLKLPELNSFVPRHISATPMEAGFSQATAQARRAVVREIIAELNDYIGPDGVHLPFRSILIRSRKG